MEEDAGVPVDDGEDVEGEGGDADEVGVGTSGLEFVEEFCQSVYSEESVWGVE